MAPHAVEAFKRYVSAFGTLDSEAILPFYDEPCLLISPQGSVALPTRSDVKQFFERLMEDLRRQEYLASEFPRLAGQLLSRTLASAGMASGEKRRRRTASFRADVPAAAHR
jgi:hypothetical protein